MCEAAGRRRRNAAFSVRSSVHFFFSGFASFFFPYKARVPRKLMRGKNVENDLRVLTSHTVKMGLKALTLSVRQRAFSVPHFFRQIYFFLFLLRQEVVR